MGAMIHKRMGLIPMRVFCVANGGRAMSLLKLDI